MATKNDFQNLYEIDCSKNVEAKGKFNYLSWAHAWRWLKERHPDATCKTYENADGWNYHTDGRYAWVKCSVTVNGLEQVETLPVLGLTNKPLKIESIDSFSINTAIKRCVTKAIGLHGLGLYLYEGEDLPDVPTWDENKPNMRGEYIARIIKACDKKDDVDAVENYRDLTQAQKDDVWKEFNPEQQQYLRAELASSAVTNAKYKYKKKEKVA